LYKPDGKIFAHYFRGNAAFFRVSSIHLQKEKVSRPLKGDIWKSSQEVTLNGGTRLEPLFLQSEHASMESCAQNGTQNNSHHICAWFPVCSHSLSLSKLQGLISKPILPLGRHDANGFFKTRNYAVRAVKNLWGRKLARLIERIQHHCCQKIQQRGYRAAEHQW